MEQTVQQMREQRNTIVNDVQAGVLLHRRDRQRHQRDQGQH